jgi:hypothetical protein
VIVLHCTRRVAAPLGVRGLFDEVAEGTSRLGDWYVNLVASMAGELFLFTSARSLASVIVPRSEPLPLQVFVRRVANLLSMLGVEDGEIEREIEHYRDVTVAKTKSRSVLASMNWIAFYCQVAFEKGPFPVSLSDLEMELARAPMQSKGRWLFPRNVVLALMTMGEGRAM